MQKLPHVSSPEKPDAVYARKLQEVIGGQYGEITVAMQYSFQAWNAHWRTMLAKGAPTVELQLASWK